MKNTEIRLRKRGNCPKIYYKKSEVCGLGNGTKIGVFKEDFDTDPFKEIYRYGIVVQCAEGNNKIFDLDSGHEITDQDLVFGVIEIPDEYVIEI